MADNTLSDAANQNVAQAGSPMRTHDNQIGVVFLGGLTNIEEWVPHKDRGID